MHLDQVARTACEFSYELRESERALCRVCEATSLVPLAHQVTAVDLLDVFVGNYDPVATGDKVGWIESG